MPEATVAEHPRSFDKGAQIENPQHLEQLIDYQRQGRHHRGYDRLAMAVPEASPLIELAAQHALPLGPLIKALLALFAQYGTHQMQHAVTEALSKQQPSANAVEPILTRRRDEQQRPPPLPVALPPTLDRFVVRPPSLAHDDQLNPTQVTDDDTQ